MRKKEQREEEISEQETDWIGEEEEEEACVENEEGIVKWRRSRIFYKFVSPCNLHHIA